MYVIKKYDGDDECSYAVFGKSQLRKIKGNQVFYGQATPEISGLTRQQALYYRDKFNNGDEYEKES